MGIALFLVLIIVTNVFTDKSFPQQKSPATEWERIYDLGGDENAVTIAETRDGGLAVGGYNYDYKNGSHNYIIVKYNRSGDLLWEKNYGGENSERIRCMKSVDDNGLIIVGTKYTKKNYMQCWLMKLAEDGNIEWEKTIGGKFSDEPQCIITTSDGGYAITGHTASEPNGETNFWLVKLNSRGDILWEKSYGSDDDEEAFSIAETPDGCFVMTGYYAVTCGKISEEVYSDLLVIKVDSSGTLIWKKQSGGKYSEWGKGVVCSDDGVIVVAGYAEPEGLGNSEAWVLFFDQQGNIISSDYFGGSGYEKVNSLCKTGEGGFVAAGYSFSKKDEDGHFWVFKFNKNSELLWDDSYANAYNEAFSVISTSDGGIAVAGNTWSPETKRDFFILKLKPDK